MVRCALARAAIVALTGCATIIPGNALAQATFNQIFDGTKSRPEFAHASFGVEIYSIDRNAVLFQWNADKLFATASTAKLLTEGAALQLLGPEFRFHTPIYRTGPVKNGVVTGDLVLVASGDPNLSGRLRPDGTLDFADEDHSYGGLKAKLVPGAPTSALDNLAQQIAAKGIRRIEGRVLIDASLFPGGKHEGGSKVAISPVSVNDNLIDVVVSPAQQAGHPAALQISPLIPYIHFTNDMTTGNAASSFQLDQTDSKHADGTIEVTLTGAIPLHSGAYVSPYPVPDPVRFATSLLAAALARAGIVVTNSDIPADPIGDSLKAFYLRDNQVAEFVSPPLREDVKVTLKTSQNLHAAMMPYVLGAALRKTEGSAEATGFKLEHDFLQKAGLDMSAVAQSDGAGASAFVTPDFMARYLAYLATQPYYQAFRNALPVLGKDGTLRDIQTDSPAAGHVYAKTGTDLGNDTLNDSVMVNSKALAGYTTSPTGEHLAFAIYLNRVPLHFGGDNLPDFFDFLDKVVSQPLGAIAAAMYSSPTKPAD